MLSNGFYENFESHEDGQPELADDNWYKLSGGEVSVATDECSFNGMKKLKGQSVVLKSADGESLESRLF